MIRFYGKKYDVSHIIFRIGVLYGPGQHGGMFIPSIVEKLLSGSEFAMTGGEQVRDFVYIADLLDAMRRTVGRRDLNGLFNVGTGSAPTMKQVALMVEELAHHAEQLVPRLCLHSAGRQPGCRLEVGA